MSREFLCLTGINRMNGKTSESSIAIKKGLRHFVKTYLAKEWKFCALFVLVTAPLAFLAPYKSYVIQWLIDAKSASEIPYLLALGGGIFLSVFLLEWVGRNLFSRINTSVARTMREELLNGVLSRDLGAFKEDTAGSYVSQFTNDITAIQNEFLTPLYNIVLYGGMLVFALFFLYRIHPLMFLIAIAMAVFPAVIPHIFARRLKKSRTAAPSVRRRTCTRRTVLQYCQSPITFLTAPHRPQLSYSRRMCMGI